MTVRVNKSAFNIREKLSELERPIGVKGNELMRAETAQDARDLVSAGRKNLIINGDMQVSQRGTSFTINSTTVYTLDRWAVSRGSISSLTVTKNTSTGLDAHSNALKIECTADASQVAGTDTWIRYGVEDIDSNTILNYPNSDKSLTLSFWVRANTAGQYSASITSGDFGDRFIHAFTVNANTWEYKSFTVPPPSQWGTNYGYGLRVYFDLGSGSTYQNSTLDQWIYSGSTYAASGNTRVTGVNGRTFEVTGVQLEVGKNATEFEHRSYGEELKLCERYFEKIWQNNNTLSPHSGGDGYNCIASGAHNGTNGYYVWKFRTQKRIRPSLDYAGKFRVFGGSSIQNLTFSEFYSPGVDAVRIRSTHSGSAGQAFVLEFDGGNSSNGYISANAEL